jgi:acyl carrier protein
MFATNLTFEKVKSLVVKTLGIESRSAGLSRDTNLMDGLPEFDSMAVLQVVLAIEADFGISLDDDEISGDIFETLGTLADFVQSKL